MAVTDKDLDDLRKELADLKNEFKSLASDGGDFLESARSKLEAEAQKLMEGMKSAGATAVEKGGEVVHKAEDKIGENPWASVAMTFGAGLALGLLLRRG